MNDQHYHRATDKQWAEQENYAFSDGDSSCILELRHRVEALETHIAAIEPLAARTQAATGSVLHLARVTSNLGHRVEALELALRAQAGSLTTAEQARLGVISVEKAQAMIERAGADAVEQLRSTPGSWQPIKTETTYGSDATIPEPREHYAPVEPEQQDKLDRLIEFDMEGLIQSDVKAADLEWARTARGMRSDDLRPAAAADTRRMLALQDQIRDGALTLAKALKEINGKTEPATAAQPLTLVERVARRLARFASEGLPGDDATPAASAVLRDVAAWLRAELNNTNTADRIEREANLHA